MKLTLEIETETGSRPAVVLRPGQSAEVGREGRDVAIPEDAYLSSAHFLISCEPSGCRVRDLHTTNGTFVNGKPILEADIFHGDRIAAGHTVFAVHTGEAGPVPPAQVDLLGFLRTQKDPLYAILDAARDPAVRRELLSAGERFESLYEGKRATELAEFAPCLVRLHEDSDLLKRLVSEAWGKSWGVYLTCSGDSETLCVHLRRFLIAELESGRKVFLRFYDPRVLPAFLGICTPEQIGEFFGPIISYMVEAGGAQKLLSFRKGARSALFTREFIIVPPESAEAGIATSSFPAVSH